MSVSQDDNMYINHLEREEHSIVTGAESMAQITAAALIYVLLWLQ